MHEIWGHVRLLPFTQRPRLADDKSGIPPEEGAYGFACTFYGFERKHAVLVPRSTSVPLITVFEDVVTLSGCVGTTLIASVGDYSPLREAYTQSLSLFTKLASQMQLTTLGSLTVSWESSDWLAVTLACVESKVRSPTTYEGFRVVELMFQAATFPVVDRVVSAMVKLQQTTQLEPRFSLNQRHVVTSLTNSVSCSTAMLMPHAYEDDQILKYLRPQWASYHMRAVSLLWSLEVSASQPQIVSIISKALASQHIDAVRESCEAFGVLWRLTGTLCCP